MTGAYLFGALRALFSRVAFSSFLFAGLLCAAVSMPAGAQSAGAAKPALSSADLGKVMKWIGQEVSNSRQQYCYRQSFGRGVGVPLSTCTPGQEKDGALCYPNCNAGYDGVGPVCWQNCPSGFRNDGAFCAKPGPYGRGGGYPWKFGDKAFSLDGARGRCAKANPQGCEKSGEIIYPKCKDGYHAVGSNICSPNCINGMTDIGVSCSKKSYGRGAGVPMKCAAGQQEDAGLCYTPCKAGFHGVGPVCWQNCPSGRKECAAGCTTDTQTCVTDTVSMVTAPIALAATIVAPGAGKAGSVGAKLATKAPKAFEAMKKAAKVADLASKAADVVLLAKDVADTTASWVDDYIADFASVTTDRVAAEVDKNFTGASNAWVKRQYALVHFSLLAQSNGIQTAQVMLSTAALLDPTGVVGVVDAFAKPVCETALPFPAVSRLY